MDARPASSQNSRLSRRNFLKIGGLSLTGLFIPDLAKLQQFIPGQQGRVVEPHLVVYDRPSFSGKEVKIYWRDTVIPITGATVGDEQPAYNRIWYRIGNEGYAHSGVIQPVKTQLNIPSNDIPEQGRLAEVTVPYTDSYWGPGKKYDVAYRFYYETVYWVLSLALDEGGSAWYQVVEDKWDDDLFVPASHLRLIPDQEVSPLSSSVPPEAKRLELHLAKQVLIAYEWEKPVYMARVASGAKFSDGNHETPTGRFLTFHKRPSRHMAAGDLASNGYDLPGVPWVCYFTEEGLSLHGTYWHNDFGKPRSHGCINLTAQAAKWIYRWTLPTVPATEQRVYKKTGTGLDIL